ncbi:MAG: peptidoglycan DD-metalloendopeptidase family protein [Flavobacteriaceae bacterium]|nr:peptidoglycan DD-metalloendopeptidase family protein [Flavobacteriaceae bacterium]
MFRKYRRILFLAVSCTALIWFFRSCDGAAEESVDLVEEPVLISEYGYTLNDFEVVRDTVMKGDTFGGILDAHGVSQNKIYEVATTFRDVFDVRKIGIGRPYVVLKSKDSIAQTQLFIYEKNRIDYAVIDFRDTLNVYHEKKPVTLIERTASGVIQGSLSETLAKQDLSPYLAEAMSDIYAWTINFFQLQAGDSFKIVYAERIISDSIAGGVNEIMGAYFSHKGEDFYAFKYLANNENSVPDYYDEEANNLRRAFLKAPVKFSRISSRYNLRRRIAHYGYKVRPHKGTDFAAPVGTPILATADGTVLKAERRGGNGIYVKLRHNATYETQYLHMKKLNVKRGQKVKQGQVIGWVGMTGNTSGPHVCYRFWKNGRQVDPFKTDLPKSEPLAMAYREDYGSRMLPLKDQLDCIDLP